MEFNFKINKYTNNIICFWFFSNNKAIKFFVHINILKILRKQKIKFIFIKIVKINYIKKFTDVEKYSR